jgi:hypothetical protein
MASRGKKITQDIAAAAIPSDTQVAPKEKKKFTPPQLPAEFAQLKKTEDQVISPDEFDLSRVIFSKIKEEDIGDGVVARRVTLFYQYSESTYGRLILDAPRGFSFGIKPIIDKMKKTVAGYSVSYQLKDREGWREDQVKFVDTWNTLFDHCLQWAFDNRVPLKKAQAWKTKDAVGGALKNPIYYPVTPEGEIDEDKSPSLSIKLLTRKVGDDVEITTKFYNEHNTDEEMNPMNLIEQRMNITPAIVMDCLYFGSAVSYMCKAYECDVEVMEAGGRRRLRRPNHVSVSQAQTSKDLLEEDEYQED